MSKSWKFCGQLHCRSSKTLWNHKSGNRRDNQCRHWWSLMDRIEGGKLIRTNCSSEKIHFDKKSIWQLTSKQCNQLDKLQLSWYCYRNSLFWAHIYRCYYLALWSQQSRCRLNIYHFCRILSSHKGSFDIPLLIHPCRKWEDNHLHTKSWSWGSSLAGNLYKNSQTDISSTLLDIQHLQLSCCHSNLPLPNTLIN